MKLYEVVHYGNPSDPNGEDMMILVRAESYKDAIMYSSSFFGDLELDVVHEIGEDSNPDATAAAVVEGQASVVHRVDAFLIHGAGADRLDEGEGIAMSILHVGQSLTVKATGLHRHAACDRACRCLGDMELRHARTSASWH